ncbi:MAG: iron-containing alcohol dehydrogenase [Bacteroidales bacterium]
MVSSFKFSRLPSIIFGNGKLSELASNLGNKPDGVVLVTGKNSLSAGSDLERITLWLNKNKIFRVIISTEPDVEIIDETCRMLCDEKISLVIAVGGGSVLDAGKAVSAMLTVNGSIADYLEGVGTKSHPGSRMPFYAIPTTAGTGSEATKNAVISGHGENPFKRSLRHDNFVPDLAIVDPLLTLSCPPGLTAASGMDCFTQLTEAFLSTNASPLTDCLALEGIKAVGDSLLRAFNNGSDKEARSGMSFAALASGICLANAGLGVVHGFASSVGAVTNIPHGLVCGTLMAVANEVTVRKLMHGTGDSLSLRKYAQLGELLSGVNGKSDGYYINWFVDYLHHLTYELKLPDLSEAGLGDDLIRSICASTESKYNPVKLDQDELFEIITRRM